MKNNSIKKLLDNNQRWAESMRKQDPDFFKRQMQGQAPHYLWIGCSDSRVTAEQITGIQPGDMFVHRNIGNTVVHTDTNLLSVVYFALKVLKVQHIIVCGHYQCGGIAAAMDNKHHGFIDNWLTHLKDVYSFHQDELNSIDDLHERDRRFTELNVIEQTRNIAKISFLQDLWANHKYPHIHGLVYNIEDGILNEVNIFTKPPEDLADIFKRKHSDT